LVRNRGVAYLLLEADRRLVHVAAGRTDGVMSARYAAVIIAVVRTWSTKKNKITSYPICRDLTFPSELILNICLRTLRYNFCCRRICTKVGSLVVATRRPADRPKRQMNRLRRRGAARRQDRKSPTAAVQGWCKKVTRERERKSE